MNYFIEIKGHSFLLVYSNHNLINGSCIALGKFIREEVLTPLEYIDSNNSNITFDELLTHDILDTVGGGWLASERLVNIINSNFPNEVQLLKTTFTYKGKVCDSYSAINVYNKIDCYDMDKSKFIKHSVDGSYVFSDRVLTTKPLEEYGLIYNIVRNSRDNKLIVSDNFVEVIKSNKINSMTFLSKL